MKSAGIDKSAKFWQTTSEPETADVAAHFVAPQPEHSLVLWWGWDGAVDEELAFRATLVGQGPIQLWDASSGETDTLSGGNVDTDEVRCSLILAPFQSRFVIIGEPSR